MELQKVCTKCGGLKNGSEFRNDKRLKSGKGSVCLICTRKDALDRRNKNIQRSRDSFKAWAKNNKEYDTARKVKWAKDNPDKKKKADNSYHHRNKVARSQKNKLWREKNSEKLKETYSLWRKKNIAYILANNKKYSCSKINRTPSWLSENDFWMIEEAYVLAKTRTKLFGFKWHVDHIIPLQGEIVCGLHTPTNLQVIPGVQNIKKKNFYVVE